MLIIKNPRYNAKITGPVLGRFEELPEWVYIVGMVLSASLSIASFVFMFYAAYGAH